MTQSKRAETVDAQALRAVLKSQYRAALAMLREAIELCTEELWNSDASLNRSWQVAYHALFFAHFYMGRDEASFRPWEQHQGNCQYPDAIPGPADAKSPIPLIPEPYTKEQALAYLSFCDAGIEHAVNDLDFSRPECGFYWYPISKLEHQLLNIRHIQHHGAQLAERVRSVLNLGVKWAGARHRP